MASMGPWGPWHAFRFNWFYDICVTLPICIYIHHLKKTSIINQIYKYPSYDLALNASLTSTWWDANPTRAPLVMMSRPGVPVANSWGEVIHNQLDLRWISSSIHQYPWLFAVLIHWFTLADDWFAYLDACKEIALWWGDGQVHPQHPTPSCCHASHSIILVPVSCRSPDCMHIYMNCQYDIRNILL